MGHKYKIEILYISYIPYIHRLKVTLHNILNNFVHSAVFHSGDYHVIAQKFWILE